jgi:hypothetical protein
VANILLVEIGEWELRLLDLDLDTHSFNLRTKKLLHSGFSLLRIGLLQGRDGEDANMQLFQPWKELRKWDLTIEKDPLTDIVPVYRVEHLKLDGGDVLPDVIAELGWEAQQRWLLVVLGAEAFLAFHAHIMVERTHSCFSAPLGVTLSIPFLNLWKPRAGRFTTLSSLFLTSLFLTAGAFLAAAAVLRGAIASLGGRSSSCGGWWRAVDGELLRSKVWGGSWGGVR